MIGIMPESVPQHIRKILETRTLRVLAERLWWSRRGVPMWLATGCGGQQVYIYVPPRSYLAGTATLDIASIRALPDAPGWRLHSPPDMLRAKDVYSDYPTSSRLQDRSCIARLLELHLSCQGCRLQNRRGGVEAEVYMPVVWPVASGPGGQRLWVGLWTRVEIRINSTGDPYISASGLKVACQASDAAISISLDPPLRIDWIGRPHQDSSRVFLAPFTAVCRFSRPRQFSADAALGRIQLHWIDVVESARAQCPELMTLLELSA